MIILIIFIPILIYVIALLYLHSAHSIKYARNLKLGKTLFVFPHPDDETMVSGGLIKLISNDSFVVTVTNGEKGNEKYKVEEEFLAQIRIEEFERAMKTLGVKKFGLWGFPDGKLDRYKQEIKDKLKNFIIENRIDTVVTYESTGLYGHPDHVALSQIVSEIEGVKKLYATLPRKIEKLLGIKKHIKDIAIHDFEWNDLPEFKIPILWTFYFKYKAAKKYKSQNLSHGLPLWVKILMMPFEYYTTRWGDGREE